LIEIKCGDLRLVSAKSAGIFDLRAGSGSQRERLSAEGEHRARQLLEERRDERVRWPSWMLSKLVRAAIPVEVGEEGCACAAGRCQGAQCGVEGPLTDAGVRPDYRLDGAGDAILGGGDNEVGFTVAVEIAGVEGLAPIEVGGVSRTRADLFLLRRAPDSGECRC